MIELRHVVMYEVAAKWMLWVWIKAITKGMPMPDINSGVIDIGMADFWLKLDMINEAIDYLIQTYPDEYCLVR